MSALAMSPETLEGFVAVKEEGVSEKIKNQILLYLDHKGVSGMTRGEIEDAFKKDGYAYPSGAISGRLQELELVHERERKIFRNGNVRSYGKNNQAIYRLMRFKDAVSPIPVYLLDQHYAVMGFLEARKALREYFDGKTLTEAEREIAESLTKKGGALYEVVASALGDLCRKHPATWRPEYQMKK